MTGLGETCTHIAAVVFYVEAIVRMQGLKMCISHDVLGLFHPI